MASIPDQWWYSEIFSQAGLETEEMAEAKWGRHLVIVHRRILFLTTRMCCNGLKL